MIDFGTRFSVWKQHILPMLLIVLVALVINVRHLNEPPAYIHAWAQADHYALALGFVHNGGDIFHPQTMLFNKQQFGPDRPESLVTSCDLPLHHWIVAGLMRITGSRQPWVFRGLTLAVSVLGLWMLYLLAFVLTHCRAKSLLVAVLTATSPAFAYYSASFLPTIPALSMAMGGLLFYALYLRDSRNWMLYVSILLLTLAMLMRTSQAVLWVAVACFQLLRVFRRETSLRESWLPFVLGAFLFAVWWLWKRYLDLHYGTLFLSSLLPVHSWDDAHYVLQSMHDRWRFHYFQRWHHWLYVLVAVGVIVGLFLNRKKSNKAAGKLSLWWLLLIWLFGELLFGVAMSAQFIDHDYYFLDSFFLPIVFLLVLMLAQLPHPSVRWGRVVMLVVVLLFAGFSTVEACRMQQERRLEGVKTLQTAVRYKYAKAMLYQNGYGSKELRFLTLFSYPQNLPFVMMDREGYSVMWTKPELVAHALDFGYDYILVEDEVYRREFDEAPYVLPHLQRLAGDGEISVCLYSDTVFHATAEDFFR